MKSLVKCLVETRSILRDSRGATMVEYALMVALIAAVAVATVTTLGTNLSLEFTKISNLMP